MLMMLRTHHTAYASFVIANINYKVQFYMQKSEGSGWVVLYWLWRELTCEYTQMFIKLPQAVILPLSKVRGNTSFGLLSSS